MAGMNDAPALYTVTQLATALGVSRQAIHDRIGHGRLVPAVQLASNAYLFTQEQFDALTTVQQNRDQP